MECNRDEAVRARDIAEQKYAKQDFLGAKKFVLKAQQLFPGLEGLSQMLAVMEVHMVSQNKIGGTEMDWYGILQVESGADDGTIKKQYRRLALLLHPDKNKALGAEAAFKLIGEAWGVLSDKTKRALHDMRRIMKSKPPTARVAAEPNVQSFSPTYHPPPAPPSTGPPPAHHAAPPNPNSTFWTSCPRCKMQYQYLRTYENYQLQCPKCKEVFVARDIHSTAGNGGFGWSPYAEAHRQEYGNSFTKPMGGGATFNGGAAAAAAAANGFMMNGGGMPFPNSYTAKPAPTGFFSSAAAAAAAQSKVAAATAAAAAAASSAMPANNLAADVVQQTFAKVKRERVEAEKEIKRKEKEQRKKEKDDAKKARDAEKVAREAEKAREAMDRLLAKRKEHLTKEENKRKVDVKGGRKLKRKRKGDDEDDGDEGDDDDVVLQDDLSSTPLPRRRSSRAKKNVTTYKVDDSDEDPDLQEFPAKRNKQDSQAEAGTRERFGEGNGREPVHGENGKGKSTADDDNYVKWAGGKNGGDELGREHDANEKSKEGQHGISKTDLPNSDSLETSRRSEGVARDSRVFESSRGTPKKPGKVDSSVKDKEMDSVADQVGGKILKSEDLKDEKSPRQTPRTLRGRQSKASHCAPSQVEEKEEGAKVDPRPQPRDSSPSLSPGSHSSGKKEEEPGVEEEEEEDGDEDEDAQIDVPDPDFFDFDSTRTENDIVAGQIWAIYDDQDGMPRFYARIVRSSMAPFKVLKQWLEPTSDKGKAWMKNTALSPTCGEFKLGKNTSVEQINVFSHIVIPRAAKGLVKIYPKKQEVWAIFRDWDPEESSGPPKVKKSDGDGFTYSYEMVEILGDFSEDKGVKAVKLVKFRGYRTLFQRPAGQNAIKMFKPSELPMFSHSVPVQKLAVQTAQELGIPSDVLELDPASTPMDLIMGPSDQSR